MNPRVRIGSLVLALLVGALLAGCAGYPVSGRRVPLREFEVVETSTKRQLTDAEMAYLRTKVADYLAKEGQTGSGDYYVKIYLGDEEGVGQGDWVIVRYTRYPSALYASASGDVFSSYDYSSYSYPTYGYSYWDYSPFAWMGLGAFSFRSFDDPYYYYGTYRPRLTRPRYIVGKPWSGHRPRPVGIGRGHDWDIHDGVHHRDGSAHWRRDTGRPSGALKPSFVPSHTSRPRWYDNAPAGGLRNWREGAPPPSTGTAYPRSREHRVDRGADRGREEHFRPGQVRPVQSPRSPSVVRGSNYQPPTRSNLHRPNAGTGSYRSREAVAPQGSAVAVPRVRPETGSRPSGARREYQRPAPARQEQADTSSAPVGRTSPGAERPWQGAGRGRYGGREP